MAVFKNCSVLLELKYLPVKEKKRLKSMIIDNGGSISFVVNKQVGRCGHSFLYIRRVKLQSLRATVLLVSQLKAAVKDMLVFLSTSEEALEVYQALRQTLEATGLQLRDSIPLQAQNLGSAALQQLLLEERLNTGSLSQEVGVFVELLWTEALGCLDNVLTVSIDQLSLNDVRFSKAEGLLLQAQKKLNESNYAEVTSLMAEVYTLLPHRRFQPRLVRNTKLISQKLDLCQLIRDVLHVSEMTLRSPTNSCLGKYRALRCSIETVPPSSPEYEAVTALLQDRYCISSEIPVLQVCRGVELQTFRSDLGNIKPLLHSSSPSNFVGIVSRGLLLPRVGVEHHGIERTDVGNLGSGIYFSDAVSTSLKYSKPSVTDGSRLLLVCDVALGRCKDVLKIDVTLTQAPEGHHSVHGVRCTPKTQSEFGDDEYVVYSPDQVKLKYVVQFSIEGDQLSEFSPAIDTSAEPCLASSGPEDDGVENIKNPLEDVTAGLLDSAGQQLPLQGVHVRCKLMDLLSQVIIFQKYTNMSSVPIEAKYVFPLDDFAAVCGFEAFINGKHVVGQVKEKEKARREYKQAIEKGHGAYLMDQDAPDVFTISVGNLPPGATVLIKVTFVSELIVRDGSIFFSLPGSVAPWQESAALNQTTQVRGAKEFTLDMSIEMPHEITSLQCITHQVKMKRTACKAVVSVLPGEVIGPDGFQLSVTLSDVHLPRMWVEKHPDKDSQACMLVFYPHFDVGSGSACDEVVLLLDTSESMKGESFRMAQRIALQVLKTLDHNLRLNLISFHQLFPPEGGSTELWRPLRALSLLPPSRGLRNLLLLSDGHIQNTEFTLQLLRDNVQHSRLFTFGLSPTANRHMLRALAQAGGGAYEFFDTKTKHNWAEKVTCQVKRMASPGCSSVSVKWQQFNPAAPTPVQAPKQLHALFNDCHTLVYGFVPHCTQATLLGNLSGQELKTMVSTSDLQKTRGTFLHKLTARALIRDYEDGSLDADEAEHEGKKAELKSFIVELSKEFSILSQFTSFVAIEERVRAAHEDDEDEFEDSFMGNCLLAMLNQELAYTSPPSPSVGRALLGTSLCEQSFAAPPPSPLSRLSIDTRASAYESSSLSSSIQSAPLPHPPPPPPPPPQPLIYTRADDYEGSSLSSSIQSAPLPHPPPPPPPLSSCTRASAYESLSLSSSIQSAPLPHPPPPPPHSLIYTRADAYEGSSLSSSRQSAPLPCSPPPVPRCYRSPNSLILTRRVVPQKEQVADLDEPFSGSPMSFGILNRIVKHSCEAKPMSAVSPRDTRLPTPKSLPRFDISVKEKASPVLFGSSSMKGDGLRFATPDMSGVFTHSEASDQVPETSGQGLFQVQKGMQMYARTYSLSKVDIQPGGVAFECGLAQTQSALRPRRGRVCKRGLPAGVLDTAQAPSFFG
uniref:Poly [ADP-ribose] polymerase n=1 Tax=Mastacembelus armatus TaxID=205130 RepID=A0A3Q3SUW4_9TELE